MSLTALQERLKGVCRGDVRAMEPMARHTSFRVGGPASLWVVCDSLGDLTHVTDVLTEEEVPWIVLGKGTNVVVSDEGYDGAVLVLGREFVRFRVDGEHLESGAGCVLAKLVQAAFSQGLSGLEFAVGVPGTLGGALVMNAGTRDDWIGSRVESLTLFQPGEGMRRLRGSEVSWGYRTAGLPAGSVVLEAVLRVSPGDQQRIRRTMETSFRRRKVSQPVGLPSAGSVFRNPPGDSAGRLIEAAGLKGTRIGGACVSDVHANFIVNDAGASAADIAALFRLVRDTVRDRDGIELEPEIRFIGPFE